MLLIKVHDANKVTQERVQMKEMPKDLQGDEYNTLVVLNSKRVLVMTAVDDVF